MITAAFDPGLTTGYVIFDNDKPFKYGQVKFLELVTLVESLPTPDVVVYENFELFKHKAKQQIGSKFETVQAIGIIISWCKRNGADLIEQRPTIKPIAQKWTGMVPTGSHNTNSHWIDAYNHGMYYLCRQGIAKTLLEQEHEAKNDL